MLADGHYVDGSWLLKIHIDVLGIQRKVRVQGDWSVEAVIGQLTSGLPAPPVRPIAVNEISLRSGTVKLGWADHGLWWPSRGRWLLQNRLSLNQYGLQADALLRLVPTHGRLRVQLPDLHYRDFADVSFTDPVFRTTVAICRHLNIRHPEELSLAFPLTQAEIKRGRFFSGVVDRRTHTKSALGGHGNFQRSATLNAAHSQSRHSLTYSSMRERPIEEEEVPKSVVSNGVEQRNSLTDHPYGPPKIRDRRSLVRPLSNWNQNVTSPLGSMHALALEFRSMDDTNLSSSPTIGLEDAYQHGLIVHPTNFMQRLRLNSTWLDSSKSLMEQGIDMGDQIRSTTDPKNTDGLSENGQNGRQSSVITTTEYNTNSTTRVHNLMLRYKYGTFYDLNQNYDSVRINQLFEQAKWLVLSEQIEVTDDEACLMAALQAHVEIASERERESVDADQHSIQNGNPDSTDATLPSHVLAVSQKPIILRDTSPIGGYLRHHQNRRPVRRARPLSSAELDFEIDAILDELSTLDTVDATSIGGSRRSRPLKRRAPRPLSQVSNEVEDPGPPQLTGYIKVCKPRRFGLKVYKRVFMAVDGLKILVYKSEQDYLEKNETVEVIYLPGCEVQPDLCLVSERYSIRLFVPVSRTNLPLSAAFSLKSSGNTAAGLDDELGLGGRLKRRASLLSLTSLSQFGANFGLQQTGGSSGKGGGLCGASVALLGLVNELVLRFNSTEAYADWLAYLRLATTVPGMGPPIADDPIDWDGSVPRAEWAKILTKSVYDSERKAIVSLIHLITPMLKNGDEVDGSNVVKALHTRLDERFADFLPIRLGMPRGMLKQWSRDTLDGPGQHTGTLPSDSKPPPSAKSTNLVLSGSQKSNISRRICLAYRQLMELSSIQAKLKYISAIEQLPNQGVAFFPAKVEVTIPLSTILGEDNPDRPSSQRGVPWLNRSNGGGNVTVSSSRHLEAVGIGPTRVFRCDFQTGEIIASWRLSAIQGWHINWELGQLVLLLKPPVQPKRAEDQRSASPPPAPADCVGRVIIRPMDVGVRVVAEFLGGYTFLNLRSPEKNQELNESFFYKLTTGSSLPVHH